LLLGFPRSLFWEQFGCGKELEEDEKHASPRFYAKPNGALKLDDKL